MNQQQQVKEVNLHKVITDRDLEGVILSRLGAIDDNSNFNSLNKYANKVQLFKRLQGRFPDIRFLGDVVQELERQGNFAYVSELDAQSQAIIKSSIKPCIVEAE